MEPDLREHIGNPGGTATAHVSLTPQAPLSNGLEARHADRVAALGGHLGTAGGQAAGGPSRDTHVDHGSGVRGAGRAVLRDHRRGRGGQILSATLRVCVSNGLLATNRVDAGGDHFDAQCEPADHGNGQLHVQRGAVERDLAGRRVVPGHLAGCVVAASEHPGEQAGQRHGRLRADRAHVVARDGTAMGEHFGRAPVYAAVLDLRAEELTGGRGAEWRSAGVSPTAISLRARTGSPPGSLSESCSQAGCLAQNLVVAGGSSHHDPWSCARLNRFFRQAGGRDARGLGSRQSQPVSPSNQGRATPAAGHHGGREVVVHATAASSDVAWNVRPRVDDRAGSAAQDHAGIAARDHARGTAQDHAGIAAQDHAGIAAQDRAGSAAQDHAGNPVGWLQRAAA